MVKARKINVVDLNEIRSVSPQEASHTETVEPIEETPQTPPDDTPPAQEAPIITEAPKEEVAMKKGDEKAACAFCNKVMTVKALRYSHDKNCKGKKPDPTVRPKSPAKTEEPPTPKHTKAEAPASQPKLKSTRAELKQLRLNNLVSQAFEIIIY